MKQIIILLIFFATTLQAQPELWHYFWAPNYWGTSPPSIPQGLLATGYIGSINVSWTLNTDAGFRAHRYILYYNTIDDSSTSSALDSVFYPTAQISHTGLVGGNVYFYWLKVARADGYRSYFSAGVNATSDGNNNLAFKFGVSEDLKFLGATSIKLRFK